MDDRKVIVEQIKNMCEEEEDWFLSHFRTKTALFDLVNIFETEEERDECIKILFGSEAPLSTKADGHYVKTKWILAEKINNEIPGFILLSLDGREETDGSIYFAFVRPKYRKKGILKSMMMKTLDYKLRLYSHSGLFELWEKFGFSFEPDTYRRVKKDGWAQGWAIR